ncbi:MAG: ferredoxin family protein [Planctomycetales bacterium]|nr:ferredoxin family protein [Planctomycetales bacterium]
MSIPKLTAIVSSGQSRDPEKREFEQQIAIQLAGIEGVRVLQVPHLYDLNKDGTTWMALRKLNEDLVVISWLFGRAAHWVLDRNGVRGQTGDVQLAEEFDESDSAEDENPDDELELERVTSSQPRPARKVYCLNFRHGNSPEQFVAETVRILREVDGTANNLEGNKLGGVEVNIPEMDHSVAQIYSENGGRRWYPVIDYSRCTNCMECIDFCLFGVYGVDSTDTILVEQADNCRKGCPACSRVCPQNAIIFPQHKTPAIAGAPVDNGGFKIDLSKLFGAPEANENALEAANRERNEQLILAGRIPVADQLPTNQSTKIESNDTNLAQTATSQDELDELINQLDSLDL